MSVHQGAQCDRASLAQNYFHNGFHFLYPEVNENRCHDGIVACELPLMSYSAALLYKLFYYDEIWFRLLNFIVLSIGFFSLFKLLKRYVHWVLALVLIVLFFHSSILLFYSNSFLPDTASLGLILIAWYLFFKQFIPHPFLPNNNSKIIFFVFVLCLSLGIALKTSSFIAFVLMSFLLIVSYLSKNKLKLIQRKQLALALILSLMIPLIWFFWSRHLGKIHNNAYFLMQIPEFNNWENYKEAWHVYYNNWPQQTYTYPLFHVFIGIFVINWFLYKNELKWTWLISNVYVLGVLGFFLIMLTQFKYHDYYIIALLPAFWFSILHFILYIKSLKPKFWLLKIGLFIIFILFANLQFNQGKKNLTERYSKNNYWEQSHLDVDDYLTFKKQISKYKISRNECILVGYDNNPNILLYLLDLRGYRFNADQDMNYLKDILNNQPRYVIVNHPEFKQKILSLNQKYKTLEVYKNIQLLELIY